jgi:hypothetical protein
MFEILFVPPITQQIQISVDQPYAGPAASCCGIIGTHRVVSSGISRQLVVATTTKPRLGYLAPASESQEDKPYHFKKGMVRQFKNGMICPPATSEAGARWPRLGLVVVATTSCRDNKVQMIRPKP